MNIRAPEIVTPNNHRYAVACVIDSSAQEVLNALVLGQSLKAGASDYDSVLLIYGKCTDLQKQAFELVWDCVWFVPDIRETLNAPNLDQKFNNLYLLTLLGYEKILLAEAHLLATQSLVPVFSIKAPALSANDKSVAWVSNQLIENDALFREDGEVLGKTDLVLLEPSDEEWDDVIDYLTSLIEESDNIGFFKDFLIKYFRGSWYSLSHEYNFRERFVVFGSVRTFGLPAHEQNCRVIGFREFIKPSDILFFGDDLCAFRDSLPELLKEVIDRVDGWESFPRLAPCQSAADRCFALYRCWFETFFTLTERFVDNLGTTLFQIVRPAPTFPLDQLEHMSKQAHEVRENRTKEAAARPPRRFQLGREDDDGNRVKVTNNAVVTRVRVI